MSDEKKQATREIVTILKKLDIKSLIIVKAGAEALKLKDVFDKQDRKKRLQEPEEKGDS